MSLLTTLTSLLTSLGFDVQTSIHVGTPPDTYIVLTPLSESFDAFADNNPEINIEEVRISLFTKSNYLADKQTIETALLSSGLTITDRKYQEYEQDTGYHHYVIDVETYEFIGGN